MQYAGKLFFIFNSYAAINLTATNILICVHHVEIINVIIYLNHKITFGGVTTKIQFSH